MTILSPQLSVILPTYNCDSFIKECMDSLLGQSFTDFEVLVVDDASKDETVPIIQAYQDDRIKLHIKKQNSGYTDSLNWAIREARGNYIARMDGDDVCHPQRFEKQIDYLKNNPDVVILGTYAQVIDSDFIFKYPSDPAAMSTMLLFGNNMVHPSVMGTAAIFKNNPYDRTREPAEDYDLWTRIATQGKTSNIPEILLYYRVHDQQVSMTKKQKQDQSARKSMRRMFDILEFDKSIYEDHFVSNAIWPHREIDMQELKKGLQWFKELKDTRGFFDEVLLKSTLSRKRYNFIKFYAINSHLVKDGAYLNVLFIKEFPKSAAEFYLNKIRR